MLSKRTDRSGLNAIILIVALMLFAGVGFYIGKTQTRPSVVVVLTNGESRTLTRANAQEILDEQQAVTADITFMVAAQSIRNTSQQLIADSDNPELTRVLLRITDSVADSLDQARANMFGDL